MKPKKWLLMLLMIPAVLLAGNVLAADIDDLLGPYENGARAFSRYEIGDKIVYFHQRMIGEAIVEKDFINYQFERGTEELIEKKERWQSGLPEHATPVITKENAESMVEGEVQFSNLYFISPESDVFPLDPPPENPCWVVRSINDGRLIVSIIDGVTGKWLGHGIPPPYEGFSLGGPNWGSCSPYYTAWALNAETWFETMGYDTEMVDNPTDAKVQSHVQSTTTAMFYELAHGSAYSFHNICPDSESITWGEVEDWIAGYTKMPFTFLGSCGGMCDTSDDTLSYEFRKGSFIDTVTVGYCGMADPHCASCWPVSISWQTALFSYMNAGWSVQSATNQALADYPQCIDATNGNCMRYAGDASFTAVPVVQRGQQDNPCCNVGPSGVGGCVDPDIEAAICAVDPYCCTSRWDSVCVGRVTSTFGDTCDCSQSHGQSEGCYRSGEADPEHISDCVCDYDSYCCRYTWDSLCVNEVESEYCGCHPPETPNSPDPADGQTDVSLAAVLTWNNPPSAAPDDGPNANTAPYGTKNVVLPGEATLPTSYLNERKAVLEAELERMAESGEPNPNEPPYIGISHAAAATKAKTPGEVFEGVNPNTTVAAIQAPADQDSPVPPGVSVWCTCDGAYETGQRVRAVVDNPYGAVGIVAGSTGTVVCGSDSYPELILISWDNWDNGHNGNDLCTCPVDALGDDSGWWVSCETVETIDVDCACNGKYDVGTKVVALVDNPSYATGIAAGATGTVLCGQIAPGGLEILISWDGWGAGHNNISPCECPVNAELTDNSGWWTMCDEIAPAPVDCACSGMYTTNDRVRAVADIYSSGVVKIPAGSTGMVICGQTLGLPILISWDNWSDGHNNTSPCDCPLTGDLNDDSGWWVDCEFIEKDNCPTTYDVYFGTTSNPTTVVCPDTNLRSCDPGTLAEDTTYYWKVVAKNAGGAATGPQWSFTTLDTCNDPPVINSLSADTCIAELGKSSLSVSATDPCGGGLTYSWIPLNGGVIEGSGSSVLFNPQGSDTPCPYHVEVIVTSGATGLSDSQVVDVYARHRGDVNGDGWVNLTDLNAVRDNFMSHGSPGWIPADLNYDGWVNLNDLNLIRDNFMSSGGCVCQ